MPDITFNEIPYDWLKPGTYVEVRANYDRVGLLPFPARALLMVQKLASGTAAAATLYRITQTDQGTALFGSGSIGEAMVTAFKKANKTSDVFAIALADAGAGVAAAGTLTFTGPATAAGSIALYIGDQRITVAVAANDTATQIATAVAAAMAAATGLPVTGAGVDEVVTLTARHKGVVGNMINLAVNSRVDDAMPAGVTCAVVAMTGGATNPDVQTLLDAIATEWFTDIVVPWDDSTNLAALAADLAARYQAMGKKDAHAYVGGYGTFGGLTTLGGLTNSPHISIIGAKKSPSAPWAWAASLGGVAAFQLADDPARQLRGLTLPGISAPVVGDRFTDDEQDLLLKGGISTFNVLTDGTVTLDRVVTTYKLSSLGATDRAWLDVMVPKTMTRIRYDWATYVTATYPRHKLADDDAIAAHNASAVVTPRRMLGSWAARCKQYERAGWIEDATATVAQSSFVRDADDRNRLNGSQQVRIIGNLMVLAAALEFQV